MSQGAVSEDSLQKARDAIARHAWREAYDLFATADVAGPLSAEDLESLAEAAWWTGRMDECIQARERAYAAYAEAGNRRRAARVALALAGDYQHKLAQSVAAGWFKRAERLLEGEPESPEHGYLARRWAHEAEARRDPDGAMRHIEKMWEIGRRTGDREVEAIALHEQGLMLIARGEVAEGMALLDEAAVAAVEGELGPTATATIYCNVISACRDLADYRRAGEWTDVARRWCERQAITGFPGHCRVYRAEIMRLRGAWREAEQEALSACQELRDFSPLFTGEAFYELGEIRLRMGDLAAAEDAFRQAHELGQEPQPGLALLRLAEGKVDAAATMIKRALADESWDRLARARSLPAQVEIAIAAGDLETARSAADEMAAIAEAYGTPALEASAACARGALQLAEEDAAGAVQSLRRGWRFWQEVDAPYEAARARVLLADAYRAGGDGEAAVLELQSAKSAFERLGALPDARRTAEMLGADARQEPTPQARRAVRTFMFTDICNSTSLVEAIGDEAWEDVLRWHDQTLRSLFAQHSGEEIKHAGDGFFVAFPDALAAVECAAAIQRTLADHRRDHGFSPQVRIGLHTAEATRRGRDYSGKGVHLAARIAALAGPGEVLASQEVLSDGGVPFSLSEPRAVTLKGISRPVPVVSVEWG